MTQFTSCPAVRALRFLISLIFLGLAGCSGENNNGLLFGIDVSYAQGNIDWATVKEQNIAFSYIKVSEGMTLTDTKFRENWQGAQAEDIKKGGYHLFTPGDDGEAQAKNFIDNLESAGIDYHGALPPVLDIEQIPQDQLVSAKPEISSWLKYVEKHLHCKPIIYTSPGTWDGEFPDEFTTYSLWLALYQGRDNQGQKPSELPDGWSNWKFWQFSDKGAIRGIDGSTNENYFNGSKNSLLLTTCLGW